MMMMRGKHLFIFELCIHVFSQEDVNDNDDDDDDDADDDDDDDDDDEDDEDDDDEGHFSFQFMFSPRGDSCNQEEKHPLTFLQTIFFNP